jgi:hypothetical protein
VLKRLLPLSACALVAAALAVPALAAPPTHTTQTASFTLTNATACGSYGVSWAINLTSDNYTFFDSQGRRTKLVQHIREDNTVRNTVTGLTLRDGPVNFVQTTFFNPETGQRTHIFIVGTAVNVRRGREKLVDRGPILIDGQTGRIIWSAGPHPVREQMEGSFNINLALPAFCHILRP